jgi:hypothetical protein
MNDRDLFFYRRLPARLTVVQVALLLGFLPHEIPVLVRSGVLKCLGRPAPNGHKYFCAVEIEQLAKDRAFLNKATLELGKHVTHKNRNQIKRELETAA